MNTLSALVQKQQSGISTLVQEVFSGIRIIKAYTREKETIYNFDNEVEIYKQKQMGLVTVNALFMPTIIFLIGLSTLLAIYIGGKMTYNNEITLGQILAFIFFVNNLTWPFASVGWVTSVIQRAAASQERINEFLKVEPDIKNKNHSEFQFKGKIEFKNVTYRYVNSNIQAVENLNFVIHLGETLGIVGNTGSGKSTIVNLIMRQFDPQSGVILIDDQPLTSINLDVFRRTTAVVPQEVFLFSDSIENNIKFGSLKTNVSEEMLRNAAKKAHVLHNIEEFPEKFETLLGERGVNLSGGQKQRVSIARALLRDADLLIFDDCLSAVDTETEEIILRNLKSEIKQKTSIVVSHRISSLRNADKIIVLDNHTIAEFGTHSELMAKQGFYAEMYERQLTEEN
jgi:ATP-binding cassette subfamily B protein